MDTERQRLQRGSWKMSNLETPTQRVLFESEYTSIVDLAKHPIAKNLNKGFVIGYN